MSVSNKTPINHNNFGFNVILNASASFLWMTKKDTVHLPATSTVHHPGQIFPMGLRNKLLTVTPNFS